MQRNGRKWCTFKTDDVILFSGHIDYFTISYPDKLTLLTTEHLSGRFLLAVALYITCLYYCVSFLGTMCVLC